MFDIFKISDRSVFSLYLYHVNILSILVDYFKSYSKEKKINFMKNAFSFHCLMIVFVYPSGVFVSALIGLYMYVKFNFNKSENI